MALKTAIITMAKEENDYVREWVRHYNLLGFTNIIIADNNNKDGQYFDTVIGDYIENEYVIIEDYRGRQAQWLQHTVFKEMYEKYKDEYDWIAFFDIDEFLILKEDKNINDYLSRDCFKNYDAICINWKVFDDNNLVYWDRTKGVMERFTHSIPDDKITYINDSVPQNDTFKSIVRGGKEDIILERTIHSPNNDDWNFCNNKGERIIPQKTYRYPSDHTLAQLNHYWYKTIEEFMLQKRKRGYPNQAYSSAKMRLSLNNFFRLNQMTEEKVRIGQKLLKNK